MEKDSRLAQALQKSGYRMTRQRWLILSILEECREHLDADEVYRRAKIRNPKVSLATVYRTLALLKQVGLVEEHRLGEDHAHFEAVQDVPHYHFTCQRCGRVVEFDAPEIVGIARRFGEQHGLEISDVHLLLSGRCTGCQSEDEV